MAFMLYHTDALGRGTTRYSYVKEVALAGDGLIYLACKKYLSDHDVGWSVTDAELLRAGGYNPSEHALIIDIAPKRQTVSLHEIKSISGYTYDTWTPLMLKLEMLFGDMEAPSGIEAMKHEFTDGDCERLDVREFLCLTGGYSRGTWNGAATPYDSGPAFRGCLGLFPERDKPDYHVDKVRGASRPS